MQGPEALSAHYGGWQTLKRFSSWSKFFEEHKDFAVRFTWIFCHGSCAQKMHTFSEQWVNLSSVRWVCFPSPGPHSKTLKTSALSSDQSSSKIPFHGCWSSACTPVLCLRLNSVSSPQALVTVFGTYPGAFKHTWITGIWDLWREMFTLPAAQPGAPRGWCFILSWE